MNRRAYISGIIVASAAALLASCVNGGGNKNNLLLLANMCDSCSFTASPAAGTGLATSAAAMTNASLATVRGKVVTAAGDPVVGAVVMLDNGSINDEIHYGSHTSINRDGSFEISGIRISDGPFYLSLEPLDEEFYQRIDEHLLCFHTPASFTSGWYAGDGNTITVTRISCTTFTLTAGQVRDLGTIRLKD